MSASAKKAKKEIIVVVKDFELGKGNKKRSWKEGDTFKAPHGWTRNLHQESVMNKGTIAMCFDEVVREEENEDGKMEAVQICTHAMPLQLKAQE